ncbi:MAG: FRG domain-containing protein [Desulfobulbaceae bacterium]|nr:MAG: FRG domain-containing protein [Desulfobulbaceae bacterium]
MTDTVVNSWNELQNELFIGSWNDSIQRYRSPFAFRGLPDSSYRLKTSLQRLEGPYWQLERHLLRNFRKYAQIDARELGLFWHLLSIAQHHGLPTRLLDWTYSPYIALHFATANLDKFDSEGVIWIVDYEKCHEHLPEKLQHMLTSEGAQAFTVELLHSLQPHGDGIYGEEASFQEIAETLTRFDLLGAEEEFLLFFEPPSINERIINQFALFSIAPNPQRSIDEWLEQNPGVYRRICIPAEMKWECRDKLDQCNISERVLFPGLDGLCSWLKRQYSPKTV